MAKSAWVVVFVAFALVGLATSATLGKSNIYIPVYYSRKNHTR
jgi:hypothetical protein